MISPGRLRERVERFQQLMRKNGIDASMIRTLSSFMYFAGIKWLRPALLIPADGQPTAFIFKYEVEQFQEKSWIRNVKAYTRVEELMKNVSETIRDSGFETVGFDYSVERDAYVLFFELFKKLNSQVEIPDVHGLIMQLRMAKDPEEIEHVRKSARISEAGMRKAVDAIEVGRTELEVAAEVLGEMMKKGAEDPHMHITTGSRPRVHAEPRNWVEIQSGDTVQIVLSADYDGYYSNLSRTIFLGGLSHTKRKAFEVFMAAHHTAEENLKTGTKLMDIENRLSELIDHRGYGDYYVAGFAHGVGLLTEEDPITTIVVPHRRYKAQKNMVLASVHAPLTVPDLGTIKSEDTYLIGTEKAERLTRFDYEITK